MSATGDPRTPLPCPRCGAELAPDQAWCLKCGLAARTRLAPPPRWRTPLTAGLALAGLALVALVVSFVVATGDGEDAADPAVPAATTAAAPAPGGDVGARVERVRSCLRPPARLVPVFAPTVRYAESQGGGAAAARFGSQKVQLLVFPTPEAAQTGFTDAQSQLIQLQLQRPDSFTRLAARLQVVGTVLQITMRGDLSPEASAKVGECTNAAAPGAPG